MTSQRPLMLVTGGSRGIGRAVVEGALSRGFRVAVWSLTESSVRQVGSELPGLTWADQVDVGDETEVVEGMKRLVDAAGPVDILVNNAGYTQTQPFLEEDSRYWRRVMDTNFWGVVYTTRQVLSSMQERSSGVIVNLVSDAGRVGMAGEAVYAGAKGGVVAFSKSIAQEMARYNIRVNCVAPGPTRTATLTDNAEEAEALIAKMIRRIPLRRIAEPQEVAALVLFLAGDEASHITGQVMSVSGGLTMV